MKQSTHEVFTRDEVAQPGSDRTFGLVMAGALALVRNGDRITIDAEKRELNLEIPASELQGQPSLTRWGNGKVDF